MKSFFVTVLFIFPLLCKAQFDVSLSNDLNIEPIIVEVPDLSLEQLYKNGKRFIQYYYSNPEFVLKSDVPNEMIRFAGLRKDSYNYKFLGRNHRADMKYEIQLSFKNKKYRIILDILDSIKHDKSGLFQDDMKIMRNCFKKDGTLKKAPVCKNQIPQIEESINSLLSELHLYLIGEDGENDKW